MSEKRQLLDESFRWIRAHVRASNLDVPDELLAQWIFEEDEDRTRPMGFHFSVFAFGCIQYDVLSGSLPLSSPRSVELAELLRRFERWQLKLALVEIHRRTDVHIAPLPLFDFPEGEKVQFWPTVSGPQSESTT